MQNKEEEKIFEGIKALFKDGDDIEGFALVRKMKDNRYLKLYSPKYDRRDDLWVAFTSIVGMFVSSESPKERMLKIFEDGEMLQKMTDAIVKAHKRKKPRKKVKKKC